LFSPPTGAAGSNLGISVHDPPQAASAA